jgi:predicted DNA-binding protein (MmcQ/YjbR family)
LVAPVKPRPQAQKAMTLDALNALCGAMPHVHHVVQWGGSHVWKVGGAKGKVFVICSFADDGGLQVTFKCSPMSYDLLKSQAGLRPAPYLASRGMTWIQRTSAASMSDAALADYLRESHRLAALNLPKGQQKALGLSLSAETTQPAPPRRRRTRT